MKKYLIKESIKKTENGFKCYYFFYNGKWREDIVKLSKQELDLFNKKVKKFNYQCLTK